MDLEAWSENKGLNQAGNAKWSTEPLREAVLQFNKDAQLFEKWELEWDAIVLGGGGFESAILAAHRKSHNTRMANFETHLLDLEDGGGVSSFSSLSQNMLIKIDSQPHTIQTRTLRSRTLVHLRSIDLPSHP
jgi:hypothetical protein